MIEQIDRPFFGGGESELSAEDEGAELDIEHEFRRKLAALRRLPRQDRSHALRAARDSRQLALKALHEKRAWDRLARKWLRRLRVPEPR
jgi:hypothetical protein